MDTIFTLGFLGSGGLANRTSSTNEDPVGTVSDGRVPLYV